MPSPILTLCVITRNEASLMPELLESVRSLVDRIIVVDPGSTDETRNAALAPIKGGWVLVLNANERLAPGSHKIIRDAIRIQEFRCGMLWVHHATHPDATPEQILSGAARHGPPQRQPRLFKYDPQLKWEGIGYETPQTWLASGRKLANLNVNVLHLGPPVSLITLHVEQLLSAGKLEKAAECLSLADKYCKFHPNLSWLHGELATLRILQRQAASVQNQLDPDPFVTGDLVRKAESHYQWAFRKGNSAFIEPVLEGLGGWKSLVALGELMLLVGRFRDAAEYFAEAITEYKGAPYVLADPALLGVAEARARMKDPLVREKLQPLLKEALEKPPEYADFWFVMAVASLEAGAILDAKQFSVNIRADSKWLSRRRNAASLATELAFREGNRVVGPGVYGLVAAFLEGQVIPPWGLPEPEQLMGPVRVLLEQGEEGAVEGLLGPEAEGKLPGVTGRMVPVLEGLGVEWSGE